MTNSLNISDRTMNRLVMMAALTELMNMAIEAGKDLPPNVVARLAKLSADPDVNLAAQTVQLSVDQVIIPLIETALDIAEKE